MSDIVPPTSAGAKAGKGATTGYPRYVFWVMFSISFLNYLDRNVLTGAATTIANDLNFSLDGIGVLGSAFLVVYTLCTVPLGIWADRVKRKNVVAICVAAWSIFTVLTAVATNFAMLFVSRMLLGIGEAGYFPAGTALMSDYFSRTKRSRIMSLWTIGQYIGILVGFALGGALAGINWRLAFIFTGIPGLFLALLAWRLREPRRNEADEAELALDPHAYSNNLEEEAVPQPKLSSRLSAQFALLARIKTMWVLIVMQIFAYFVLGVNLIFLPTYLQQKDTFGLKSGQAGLFSGAVIVLAGAAGVVLGGYMADILNRRHQGARILVCGIGFLLSAPCFAMAMLFHNFVIFTVFFVLTVLLVSVYNGPSTAATQDVVPSALRASALALTLLIAHLLGDAFSPTIVGVLATSFDPTHGLHFHHFVAGQDLSIALLITCTPALVVAGLVGIFGARWMKEDVAAAEQADRLARE